MTDDELLEIARDELRRQAETGNPVDFHGDRAQVDGSFDLRALIGAVIAIAIDTPPHPPEFKPEHTAAVSGRGIIMTGPYPFDEPSAVGRTVLVQGEAYAVTGMEWQLGHAPRRGDSVGLVVRKVGR